MASLLPALGGDASTDSHPVLQLVLRLRRIAKHSDYAFFFDETLDRITSLQVRCRQSRSD